MDDDREENQQLRMPQNIPSLSSSSHDSHMVRTIQHLIERCLTFFMDREECARCLEQTANLKPSITRIVWDELEKSNAEFFATYSKNRQEALENARFRHADSAAAATSASASASANSSATTAASSSSNNLIMEFPQENAKGS